MLGLTKRNKTQEIPNTRAAELTGKKDIKLEPDNSYSRKIGSTVKTKKLVGTTGPDWVSKK